MITTAVPPTIDPSDTLRFVIVIEPDSTFQQELALQLAKRISMIETPYCEISSILTLPNKSYRDDTVFVFLQELEHPFLHPSDSNTFVILQNTLTTHKRVLWWSKGGGRSRNLPHFGIIDGLSRAVRAENEKLTLIIAALDTNEQLISQQVDTICRIIEKTEFHSMGNNCEPALLEMDGTLQIGRINEAQALSRRVHDWSLPFQSSVQECGSGPPLEMRIGNLGLLDSIYFGEDEAHSMPLAPDEVEIQVHVVGLNFKDCLIALGRVPGQTLGNECAGTITRVGPSSDFKPGERVCAATQGCFKTFARASSQFVLKIPSGLAFAEATALPATFVTARIAIHHLAKMEAGESILIHTGAGGTGQARDPDDQIAKCLDANIFVTVGSLQKKQWLMYEYKIPEDHIFYSRDASFAQGIQHITKNGIDVILNSLAGESLVASWECIAPFGRFIEIGKKDILFNSNLPMSSFEKNVTFHALDASIWMKERPKVIRKSMEQIFDLVEAKKLHAARPLHIYGIDDVENAFRYLQEGRNIGKVVIEISVESPVPVNIPLFLSPVFPLNLSLGCASDKTQLFVQTRRYLCHCWVALVDLGGVLVNGWSKEGHGI